MTLHAKSHAVWQDSGEAVCAASSSGSNGLTSSCSLKPWITEIARDGDELPGQADRRRPSHWSDAIAAHSCDTNLARLQNCVCNYMARTRRALRPLLANARSAVLHTGDGLAGARLISGTFLQHNRQNDSVSARHMCQLK